MNVEGKKVCVVGLGRSGVAAANLLARRGAQVTACDQKSASELDAVVSGLDKSVTLRFGTSTPEADCDWVVLSPGVNPASPVLEEARRRGVEIIGELELGYRFCSTPIIAVTGTNGKSTTASLLGRLLRAAGRDVAVCGNIGTPLTACLDPEPGDYLVVEVSSFQLETIREFHPRIALVLNLSADHLDRHPSLEDYAAAKEKITRNQGPEDILVLNQDDARVRSMGAGGRARRMGFSIREPVDTGACLLDGALTLCRSGHCREVMPLAALPLAARLQIDNLLAALTAADAVGVSLDTMRAVLEGFTGMEHRLEWVRSVGGVDFINDSKGTNVGAVEKALSGIDRPVILIMGGRDKGGDFSRLKDLFRQRVKHMVLMGEARPKIQSVLNGSFGYEAADSMAEAVQRAWAQARPGDVILLSPGCASFDMFRDYEERGRVFKDLVRRL